MGIIAFSSFVLAPYDAGQEISGASVQGTNETRGNTTATGSDIGSGGNISEMNLSTEALTAKWQGYFGNASIINLRLGNNGQDNLYTWGASTKHQVRGVFASTGAGFDFSLLNLATTLSYDFALGYVSRDDNGAFTGYWPDADTVTNTMVSGQKYVIFPNDDVGKPDVANLSSYSLNNGVWSQATNKFSVGIFVDRTDSTTAQTDFAVGVNVSEGAFRSYDNSTDINYELMVPVNASTSSVGQTYYFFIAIR